MPLELQYMPCNERNVHCSGSISVPNLPTGLALENPEAPLGRPAKERFEKAANYILAEESSLGNDMFLPAPNLAGLP